MTSRDLENHRKWVKDKGEFAVGTSEARDSRVAGVSSGCATVARAAKFN